MLPSRALLFVKYTKKPTGHRSNVNKKTKETKLTINIVITTK